MLAAAAIGDFPLDTISAEPRDLCSEAVLALARDRTAHRDNSEEVVDHGAAGVGAEPLELRGRHRPDRELEASRRVMMTVMSLDKSERVTLNQQDRDELAHDANIARTSAEAVPTGTALPIWRMTSVFVPANS